MKHIYFSFLKVLLRIADSLMSFIQKTPKIFAGVFLFFGIFSAIDIGVQGYLFEAAKVCGAFAVIATAVYYISLIIYKPIGRKVEKSLDNIRLKQHDINCGLYMLEYQKQLNSTDDIDKMLSFKELLETNILLSSLKYRVRMLFDDAKILNYENILDSGLAVGNALCFSGKGKGKSKNKDQEQNKNEFVIDTDVFIKEFNEYCKNEDDVYNQIKFIKDRQKQIKEDLEN